jgi:6-pyruvoyl-tetrahydropterin synthase
MNKITFTPEIEKQADRYINLFLDLQLLKNTNKEVYDYLHKVYLPDYTKQKVLPPLETVMFRVMVDLLARKQVFEQAVVSAAEEKASTSLQ